MAARALDLVAPDDPGSATLAWTRAVATGAPDAAALGAVREAARDGSPIARIVDAFDLAPFDEELLLLLAAGARDPATAAALGEGAPTIGEVLALLGHLADDAVAAAWRRLAPAAPLRRFALIRTDGASLSARLAIDARVAAAVDGEDAIDVQVASLLRPLAADPLPATHDEAVDTVVAALTRAPAVLVQAAAGGGRRAVAAAAAARLGRTAVLLRTEALPSDPAGLGTILPLLAREAALLALLPVAWVDGAPPGVLDALLHGLDAPLLLLGEARPAGAEPLPAVRLPPLDRLARADLWTRAGAADGAALADRFAFGPSDIAALGARGDGAPATLWHEAREMAAARLGGLAERIEPRRGWDSLVLPPAVLATLRAVADGVRHRDAVFGRGGFAARHPAGQGIAALFAGASGTGKTLAAEVLARDLGLDLYRVDLSRVVSKYIGETEKNLRAVFEAAEAGGAVLLFDEADALFGRRSEVKDAHDRYANIEVGYLLQRMEASSGLAILATNMKEALDAAFLRRLRFVVDFPSPDGALRRALWASAFPPETATAALDLDALARLELAGGNIVVVALNAAFAAAGEGGPVTMRHVEAAARAEYRKLDKELRPWP